MKTASKQKIANLSKARVSKTEISKQAVKSVSFTRSVTPEIQGTKNPLPHCRTPTTELYEEFDDGKALQDYEELEELNPNTDNEINILDLMASEEENTNKHEQDLNVRGLTTAHSQATANLEILAKKEVTICEEDTIPIDLKEPVKLEVVVREGSFFKPQIIKTVVMSSLNLS